MLHLSLPQRRFKALCAVLIAFLLATHTSLPAFAASPPTADPVIEWNAIVLHVIQGSNTTPPAATRNMAMMHTAIYDAVNSIEQTHQPYHAAIPAAPGASTESAAIAAAHRILIHLYPEQTSGFNTLREQSLARIPDGPAKQEGIRVGEAAAENIIAWRNTDKANDTASYTPQHKPGYWEPTPPGNLPPLYPHWGKIASFSKSSLAPFMPPGPPALHTEQYARELEEVRLLGRVDSTSRTADQTQIAHFWEDGPGTFTPPGHWNVIAQDFALQQNTTLAQNAHLFALLNIAMADAAIVCWDAKYTHNFWRPVTAIRKADTDGNPSTTQDADWMPLLGTPPFPEYTSGHSTFSGAASVVLASFFGNDTPFETYSIENPDIRRTFANFTHAAQEAADSRLYGGIHFRTGNQHGLESGQALGTFIAQTLLQPLGKQPAITAQAATHTAAPSAPVTAKTGFSSALLLFFLILGSGGLAFTCKSSLVD